MKFSELKCCPFCGNDEYYEKYYAYGSIIYNNRFDGEETDNSLMYDSLNHKYSGRTYCRKCHRYLGNAQTDTLGKEAEKRLVRTI